MQSEFNPKTLKSSIKISDFVIKIGLIASGLQLAYAFSYDSFLSWLSAGFKSAFIEISVWVLTQALLRSHVLSFKSRLFIWVLLVFIFLVSTRANLQYELSNISASKDSSFYFEDKTYTFFDYVDAWLRSAILPALVLGLIYARVLITKGFYAWQQEQIEKKKQRIRYERYKKKRKRLLRELS